MAATAWVFYNAAKNKIGNGTIDLTASTSKFRLALYMSAASATVATAGLTIQSQIGSQVSGGTYPAGGLTLAGVTWGFGATSAEQKWDCTDPVFTASGSAMSNVSYGVIVASVGATSGYPLVWSRLSTAGFDVTTGNTLTVQMNASGIFTLA